jgi:hypothetical protein
MKNRINDDKLVSQFLLGEVSEEQKAQLEERFFNDDEYFDYMLALEDELIDDYAQGALSKHERELFEKRFLNSPERRSRVEFAKALHKTASLETAAQAERTVVATESKSSWWQGLLALIGFQGSAMQFALAAATIVLLLGCAWLAFESSRLRNQLTQLEAARTQKEKETADQVAEQRSRNEQLAGDLERERNEREQTERQLAQEKERREKASPGGLGALVSFVLTAGLLRDEQGVKRLAIPQSAEQVRLQLTIRRAGEYTSYRAALQTIDGAPVWNQVARKANPSGKAVVVNLPGNLLKSGDYKLALTGLTAAGNVEEIDNYYFSVVKK